MEECRTCNKTIVWLCHILRPSPSYKGITGYGKFCCPGCALGYLHLNNHGNSDYYNSYALIHVKYSKDDGQLFVPFERDFNFDTTYRPDNLCLRSQILEEVESTDIILEKKKYNVKKKEEVGSRNKAIERFFEGKEEAVKTAANLCPTK
jgi:hypothetical protein